MKQGDWVLVTSPDRKERFTGRIEGVRTHSIEIEVAPTATSPEWERWHELAVAAGTSPAEREACWKERVQASVPRRGYLIRTLTKEEDLEAMPFGEEGVFYPPPKEESDSPAGREAFFRLWHRESVTEDDFSGIALASADPCLRILAARQIASEKGRAEALCWLRCESHTWAQTPLVASGLPDPLIVDTIMRARNFASDVFEQHTCELIEMVKNPYLLFCLFVGRILRSDEGLLAKHLWKKLAKNPELPRWLGRKRTPKTFEELARLVRQRDFLQCILITRFEACPLYDDGIWSDIGWEWEIFKQTACDALFNEKSPGDERFFVGIIRRRDPNADLESAVLCLSNRGTLQKLCRECKPEEDALRKSIDERLKALE